MKKNRLWSMFAAAAVVLLAGCEAKEVKAVKGGVLGIDKSRTVEQVLSAKLGDLKWKKIVNDKNQTIVKASGVWKDKNTISYKPYGVETTIVAPGFFVEVCFCMNVDGTFQFQSGKFFREGTVVTSEDLYRLRGGFLGVLYD